MIKQDADRGKNVLFLLETTDKIGDRLFWRWHRRSWVAGGSFVPVVDGVTPKTWEEAA